MSVSDASPADPGGDSRPASLPAATPRTGQRSDAPRKKRGSTNRPPLDLGIAAHFEAMRRKRVARLLREPLQAWPAWLISLALHGLLLLGLAFYAITEKPKQAPLELISGWVTEQARAAAKKDALEIAKTRPVVTIESVPAGGSQPLPAAAAKTDVRPTGPVVRPPLEVDVSRMLSSRSAEEKQEILKSSGNSDAAEKCVTQALTWLKRVQQPDGRWQLHEERDRKDAEPRYPDAGTIRSDTGATALAILCFSGAGHTHQSGSFSKDVAEGVRWLLKHQQPDGLIYEREFDGPAPIYSHALATIALAELLALSGDPGLKEPVERALVYICAAQNPTTGGWKYRPQQPGGDLSVLGWQVMALTTGRAAGIAVNSEVFDGISLFLTQVEEQDGAVYKYDTEPASKVTPAMTAVGLLCRQYLGWPANHPALVKGAAFVLRDENRPRWEAGRRNVYYWYYATQMLHHLGGEPWKTWQAEITPTIVEAQDSTGSFSPRRPEGHPEERAREGGRLYITCLSVLILETPYRHRSLYEGADPAPAATEPQRQ